MRWLPSFALVTGLAVLVACAVERRSDDWPNGPFDGGTVPAPNLRRPDLGPTTVQAVRPPPIYGGTLLVTADDRWAVAGDPDRDQIYVVGLAAKTLHATIPTGVGSQPFRAIESAPGIVSFTLRGTGQVVTVDAEAGVARWTAAACVEPRGVAYDPATKTLSVACEHGQIVSLDVATGATVRTITVQAAPSLRDIFVEGDGFWVSEFRTVRLLRVDANGVLLKQVGPNFVSGSTAWRTRRIAPDAFAVTYQKATNSVTLSTSTTPTPGAYGGGGSAECKAGAIVGSMLSIVRTDGTVEDHDLGSVPLPVDVAYTPVGDKFLVPIAGNSWNAVLPKYTVVERSTKSPGACPPIGARLTAPGIVAAEIGPGNVGVILSREPAVLQLVDLTDRGILASVELSTVTRRDTGHILFHANSGVGIACASCHPEGADDGRVWTFTDDVFTQRVRRTPSLRGTILGTAPYHWDGEEPNLDALFDDVMTGRMDGPSLDGGQRAAFASWLQQLPAPGRAATANDPAVARGDALFHGDGKCIGCHGDAKTPSTGLYDVGTGGAFGAPPLLGVSLRAPFMHDGCAATLEQRFLAPCGGTDHGPSTLTDENRSDLVAYLESL